MKSILNNFFDGHPVLYPFPKLLIEHGYSRVFRLRDLKFKQYFEKADLKKGMRVLDVGCGDGLILKRLAKTYAIKGVGVDSSPESIKRASCDTGNMRFICCDAINLNFGNNTFDVVYTFDTLEHIFEQKKAIKELVRVTKKGGRIIIYTINKKQKFTWNYFLSKAGVDIYDNYDHDPRLFLDADEVVEILTKSGAKIQKKEFYGSFFTILVDELIMVATLVCFKIKLFKYVQRYLKSFLNIIYCFLDISARILLPVLSFCDLPWTKNGYSNGFFIYAIKK